MPDIYLIGPDRRSAPLARVYCQDETAELQELLASNPNLLPGDQIDPDDPCRWLLVRREVPVPDPGTGADRWSIDVLLVDQNAIPTLVECKRFLNTQSRREVVGQMLEYAANGHYYWSADSLRQLAESAGPAGDPLEKRLVAISPEGEPTASEFFERVENNLREGQIRLVFFLEEAPPELKSIVDFLNRQMERAEVLIVEARQFEVQGMRFVAPSLFGYTEQARMIKRSVTVSQPGRRIWTEETYFADVRERLDPAAQAAMSRLFRFLQSVGCTMRWGSGRVTGSFSAVPSLLGRKSLLTAYSSGGVTFNLAHISGNAELELRRQKLLEVLRDLGVGISPDQEHGYPSVPIAALVARIDDLEKILSEVVC